jgi:hypothetical protein
MAITTADGMVAEAIVPIRFNKNSILTSASAQAAGKSYWASTGYPPAGSYSSSLNGSALSGTTTGAFNFPNPASGNTYLSRFEVSGSGTIAATYLLCDRLWHNGGFTITSTSAQSITSPTWPARDANGSTNGDGVLLALEMSVGTGSAAPTVTVSYTNSGGTAGRSATNIVTMAASTHRTGDAILLGLQGTDTGVRSVQSLTLSASWVTGTINLVAYRPIAMVGVGINGEWAEDAFTMLGPRIYDSSVLYLMSFANWSTSHESTAGGMIQLSQG